MKIAGIILIVLQVIATVGGIIGAIAGGTNPFAGGLAGALYGYDAIPEEWRNTLLKREYIENLCERAFK